MMTHEQWVSTYNDPELPGKSSLSFDEERDLCENGVIEPCELEFGPHTDHSECVEEIESLRDDGAELLVDYLFSGTAPHYAPYINGGS